MPVWNDKMAGHQSASGQVSVNSALTWSLLFCNGYQFCSWNMWVLQHHPVHAFDMSTIIGFVYFGLQVKWNQFSSNNSHYSHYTSCIHKGLHAGKWPDLMTSKPHSVSTLESHWTDQTGRPLESQVHWDATGTTLADASIQWYPNGDPVLICIIGTHWNTTGATSTLGCHWNHTGWCLHPVVSQWQSSVNLHNWNTLEHHWKCTGYQQFFLQWHSSVHLGLNWIATGLPLDYHWLMVRDLTIS